MTLPKNIIIEPKYSGHGRTDWIAILSDTRKRIVADLFTYHQQEVNQHGLYLQDNTSFTRIEFMSRKPEELKAATEFLTEFLNRRQNIMKARRRQYV